MEIKAQFLLSLFLSCFLMLVYAQNHLETYIVQLHPQGLTRSSFSSKLHWHLSFIEKAISSEEDSSSRLLYSYHSAMEGFAARLSKSELEALHQSPDVVAVRPERRPRMTGKIIKRRLTNVGRPNSVFSVQVTPPEGVKVRVKPRQLIFRHTNETLSYKVYLISKKRTGKEMRSFAQGSLTWFNSNGRSNKVKSPISVTWRSK
ncbi:OLC1v1006913C1 [Oldenlandia corymbosa var. corymbosa]|uniref:OLC1v1006913C1 n=1 Tax=Oldenlandia corymbosa var. corymbosa TaxID=529605 RepID=A0AAV1DI75_OLDCO|nr:OLC1v1006913C1 [Oldenlandia corymbosa var. corymbosa]